MASSKHAGAWFLNSSAAVVAQTWETTINDAEVIGLRLVTMAKGCKMEAFPNSAGSGDGFNLELMARMELLEKFTSSPSEAIPK